MQGYTLSEEGKRLIKLYNTRKNVCSVVTWVGLFFIVLFGYYLLRDMPILLRILILWVAGFIILRSVSILLRRKLFNYIDILYVECNPKLFLEVVHGLMRTGFWGNLDGKGKRGIQLRNSNMINACAAYSYMGEYTMAVDCLKGYISVDSLKGYPLLIYYNNLLACYAGLKDWEKMRAIYEKVRQTANEIQQGRYPRNIVLLSEQHYENCRRVMMEYEILTLEGRFLAANLIHETKEELDKATVLIRRMNLLGQIAGYHIVLQQYDEAVDALETIVREGKQLYNVTLAKKQLRMIHDRDSAIELLEEGEVYGVKSILLQQGKDISEEELRNSVIYVLHEEDGNIAGIARITNLMKLGELVMNPLYDTDKNRFRLMEEMKRREYTE